MLADLADVVLSRACIACDRLGPVVCTACWDLAAQVRRHEASGALLPPILVGTPYEGVGRQAVTALKERGVLAMADPVGAWLALAIATAVPRCDGLVLVPIPPHRTSVTARGIDTLDHVVRRALRMLRASGRDVQGASVLRRTVDRGRQVGMRAEQRRHAVAGSFSVREGVRDLPVRCSILVVDDVVTTGATVGEAVRVLGGAGIEVAAVAAACGTPRSGQAREPGLDALDDGIDT